MTLDEFECRASNNGGYDRLLGDWKILDIHRIPEKIKHTHEIDFYCANSSSVYLLRLRNREDESFKLCDEPLSQTDIPYLIAELPIHRIDNDLILTVLGRFNLPI